MQVTLSDRSRLRGVRKKRLVIGPTNMAGQGWAIARAVETHRSDVRALAFKAERSRPGFDFPSDYSLSPRAQLADLTAHRDRILSETTHMMFEAGRPMLAEMRSGSMLQDLPDCSARGIGVAALFHGSEVRDPRLHRELYDVSPFDPSDELTQQLQPVVDATLAALDQFPGPRFVTTPDLLDFVPEATWAPLVVDLSQISPREVLSKKRPIVVHAPSNSALKGSAFVDPVLEDLDARGVVEYRRVSGMPHSELIQLLHEADIVVDQAMLGSYGVFAVESMAAGNVTLVNVAPQVRERIGMDVPTFDFTPTSLSQAIEQVLDDRDQARTRASLGPAYAAAVHDGRRTVHALLPFLGALRERKP